MSIHTGRVLFATALTFGVAVGAGLFGLSEGLFFDGVLGGGVLTGALIIAREMTH